MTTTFFLNPRASGYNSLVQNEDGDVVPIEVRVPALDDLLPNVNADLIKIDIEGSELGALRGGEMLIKRSRPVIIIRGGPRNLNS
ncbi:MAG: FkbM family methyltransferase [Verrucomicrobia bacterium]|nr:FkbM family methyltransferase [Verrucomicrobiota bacterium]